MDPLTQGLLGACVGQACYGRAMGRRAVVWGALVGMAPDLDVLGRSAGPMGDWLWHRGPTHALLVGTLAGAALAWPLWKALGGRLRDWAGLCVLALVTHPLLDLFTSYGTQLLWPFSRHRFALDAIAIVDPAYSLVLAAAVAVGLRRGVGTTAACRAAWVALGVSSAYLGLGLALNARAESIARKQLEAEGVTATVAAYPTLLQLPRRRVVARRGDEVRVGWVGGPARRAIAWEHFVAASGPEVEAARATPEVRLLEWFAMGQATPRLEESGTVVEFDDLRYGVPGRPRDGLWGVRVRLDRAGRPIAPAERFARPLPTRLSELLGQMRAPGTR